MLGKSEGFRRSKGLLEGRRGRIFRASPLITEGDAMLDSVKNRPMGTRRRHLMAKDGRKHGLTGQFCHF